jgi:hypothetical protein
VRRVLLVLFVVAVVAVIAVNLYDRGPAAGPCDRYRSELRAERTRVMANLRTGVPGQFDKFDATARAAKRAGCDISSIVDDEDIPPGP